MLGTSVSFAQTDVVPSAGSASLAPADPASGADTAASFTSLLNGLITTPDNPASEGAAPAELGAPTLASGDPVPDPAPAMVSGNAATRPGKILPPGLLPVTEEGTEEPETALPNTTVVANEPPKGSQLLADPAFAQMALPAIPADSAPVGVPVDNNATPQHARVDPRLDLQHAKPIAIAPAGDLADPEDAPPTNSAQPGARAAPASSPGSALSPAPPAPTGKGQDGSSDRPSSQRGPEVALPAPALQAGPAPAQLPQPEFAADLPQPVSGAASAATPTLTPTAAQQADLAAVVDRLAAARAALAPLEVTMDLDHPEFGEIGINFRQDRLGVLTVDVTAADADLGRTLTVAAVRAGSEAATTSHQDGSSPSHTRTSASDRDSSDPAQRGSQGQRETPDHLARRTRTSGGRDASTETQSRASRHGTYA